MSAENVEPHRETPPESSLLRFWPLIVALALFAVIVLLTLRDITRETGGPLVYGLDDAYIHMSIARNFAEHGVWGITQYEYSSSTSSPLWTALIAGAYMIFGVSEAVPLVLNLLVVAGMLAACYAVLRRHNTPVYLIALALLALVLVIPVETYVYIGMEHLLHATLTIIFAVLATEAIIRKHPLHWNERDALLLYALGMLLPVTRYEGAGLVVLVAGLLVLRGRWRLAIPLAVLSAVPVIAYGLIAVDNGWPFLPASVMLKSIYAVWEVEDINTAGAIIQWVVGLVEGVIDDRFFVGLAALAVLALLLRTIVAYRAARRIEPSLLWNAGTVILLILLGYIFIHQRLAGGPVAFERYSVYMVVLALIAFVVALGDYLPRLNADASRRASLPVMAAAAGLLVLFAATFASHNHIARTRDPIVNAASSVYQQQYQMAQFLATYYNDDVIVANDIGAITYFTDIRLFDIFGLGTRIVAESRLERTYSAEYMSHLAKEAGAEIGLVYYQWIIDLLVGEAPADWLAVSDWRIPDKSVLGNDTVTFYSLADEATGPLVENLLDFRDDLPPNIVQRHHLVPDQ